MSACRWHRDEVGAATVWTLALLAVVLVSGMAVSAVVLQVGARQRAATAAEIAALAGAQSVGDPCSAARQAAAANGAMLVSCSIDGADVQVTVSYPRPPVVRRVAGLVGGESGGITASARAGPAP